jgi:hypothetical protein
MKSKGKYQREIKYGFGDVGNAYADEGVIAYQDKNALCNYI